MTLPIRLAPAALAGGLALAFAGQAGAQLPLSARSLGMAGSSLAVARGYETLYANPANLALAGTPRWSIGLGQILAGGTLRGPSMELIPDLVQYDDLSDARKAEVLAGIPATGVESTLDVRAPLFGLQVGPVALGVAYGATGQGSIGKDLVDLLVNGYEEGRTDYSVGNTAGSRMTYWDAALGIGRQVGSLSVGVTGHYFRAGTTARTRLFEPRIYVEEQDVEVDLVTVLARGGSGYGVDFGASFQPSPALTLSGSVTNAITSLTWSDDLRVRTLTVSRADMDDEGQDAASFLERYEDSEQAVGANVVSQRVYQTAEGLYAGGYFPATLRLGAGWELTRSTSLSAAYAKHLTEGVLDGSWDRTVAVGLEQNLWILGLRGGYATDLAEGRLISAGLRLGPMNVGLARVEQTRDDGVANEGWLVSAGLGVSVGGR